MMKIKKLWLLKTLIISSLALNACNNSDNDSSNDTSNITTNNSPTAIVGSDQTVTKGTTVSLDASASSDADGDTLSYDWVIISKPYGSSAELSSSTVVNPTFTADAAGDYMFRIIISDGSTTAYDQITITATDSPGGGTQNMIMNVESSHFTTKGLTITMVDCNLSDGTATQCYEFSTTSIATDHDMGPWCPTTITDGAEKGGIWLVNGTVHDVSGNFITTLANVYNDAKWKMYDDNGNVQVTQTEDDCINAANPNVGNSYNNYCVECLPSYITDITQTWRLPITPIPQDSNYTFAGPGGPPGVGTGPSSRGIALNGVELSAPAPIENIIGAYTIAPFDDAGGHINVHQGYHYHTATGISQSVAQSDAHAPLIGYAFDGFGIYANKDSAGNVATDLDECRGQYDDVRGYHYHADDAGANNFINCLKGAYAI